MGDLPFENFFGFFCGYRDGVRKLREFLAVLFHDFALAGMYKLLWG